MCADDPHKDDPGVPVFPNLADALLALAARWAADLKSRSDDRSEKIVEAVGRLLVDQHVVCGAGCYRNCQDGTWALMTSAGGKPGGPGFPVKLHVQAAIPGTGIAGRNGGRIFGGALRVADENARKCAVNVDRTGIHR